nr:Fibrinogen-like coiled coil protein [uncultured Mediterranean phage uvMED]
MKISDNTSIAMPMRNLISIVVFVAVGVWAYFGIVERINILETSEQLMKSDLLKRAEQTPKNLEMLMLIEMNAKLLEKHQMQLDENIHTKVLLTEANKKIEKLQEDVEKLIRNGSGH